MARRRRTQQHAEEIRASAALDPLRDFQGNAAERMVARVALYLRQHLRQTLIGVGIVAVALLSAIGVRLYLDAQEQKSLADYEALLANPLLDPDNQAGAAAIAKVDEYLQQHDSASSSKRGLLLKFGLELRAKNFGSAAQAAMALARQIETPELRGYLYLQAGACFEDAEKLNEALNAYSLAVDDLREDNVLRATARFGQSRALFALGRRDDGRKALEELFAMNAGATIAGEYDVRAAAVAFALANGAAASQP
ncbi:MAG: hypothetical protein K1X75_02745 [Leptospirales bacterium]|nr:hypothetical protein [Leptospirales bacterium]